MTFKHKLNRRIDQVNSCVCVGLDAVYPKIPQFLKKQNKDKAKTIFKFNQAIIDQTHDLVCAYKPNLAFYEAMGAAGWAALKQTVDYIHQLDKNIITVADAKRADIGHTNQAYAASIFDYFAFDALTVHPYLGSEALEPLLSRKNKGIIVLCRTSNPGAAEFQDLEISLNSKSTPLYEYLAQQVKNHWNQHNNCALVVGATYPEELAKIRKIVNDMPLLIPGVGSQGGDIQKTVRAGQDNQGSGMIINSSRSIIFASSDKDFAQAARSKTNQLKQNINQHRIKSNEK